MSNSKLGYISSELSKAILNQIIKKDRPALIIETGDDITSIEKYLKKYGFNKYFFSNKKHKFFKIKNYYPLNTYFLQKKHLSI